MKKNPTHNIHIPGANLDQVAHLCNLILDTDKINTHRPMIYKRAKAAVTTKRTDRFDEWLARVLKYYFLYSIG